MDLAAKESVIVSREGGVALVTINRPESLNALNHDVLQSLIGIFEKLALEKDLRIVLITGAGEKAFVAGADIKWMEQLGKRALGDFLELGQRAMRTIESFPKPVIAVVNGFALGGGLELALACDVIFCATEAKLGLPEVTLGIIPGFGGTQRLVQRVGVGRARKLIYSGEMIGAADAYAIGVVDHLAPVASLLSEAQLYAQKVIANGPLAVEKAKKLVAVHGEAQLLAGLRHEVEGFLELAGTADQAEGMRAFLERRKAHFTGR